LRKTGGPASQKSHWPRGTMGEAATFKHENGYKKKRREKKRVTTQEEGKKISKGKANGGCRGRKKITKKRRVTRLKTTTKST